MTRGIQIPPIARAPIDGFIVALAGVVLAATILPCRGASALAVQIAGMFAISAMFFLQGARLSRDAILNGMMHWRLHVASGAATFILFPILGLGLIAAFPNLLPGPLYLGVLFVCALPSTVQSSIALTSIARGNVPAAICAATISNITGIVVTPLMFSAMANLHNGSIELMGTWKVATQLLLPFLAGHLLRPWIGAWTARNRGVLAITDRGSILLVVYGAFSAAVVRGIWQQIPPVLLVLLLLVMSVLLSVALLYIRLTSGLLGFDREDEAAFVFIGSQKSLVSGIPIANALIPGPAIGPILVPMMLYHAMQLLICAWIARRYAAGEQRLTSGVPPGAVANLGEPVPVSVIDHREPSGESVTVLASIIALVGKP
jgi:solute carrier family 10 (sodium/bile acid cotransporter), member 7